MNLFRAGLDNASNSHSNVNHKSDIYDGDPQRGSSLETTPKDNVNEEILENKPSGVGLFSRAAIYKVFMPRSKTSTSCNLVNSTPEGAAEAVVANNGATTDWSYLGGANGGGNNLPNQPRRTASLSRNLTRRSRSVTMPNMPPNVANTTSEAAETVSENPLSNSQTEVGLI